MANNLKGRSWILDTASASAVKSGITIVDGFTFRGYTTDGHKAQVKDFTGEIIAEMVGNADLTPVSWGGGGAERAIRELTLSLLDSGKVIVDVA